MNAATAHPAKLKVFLVEDNADTRLMLTLVLQEGPYQVQAVGTMEAALQNFPYFGGEVLLSDLGLPDGDGRKLLVELRKAGLAPYAIAMSGLGMAADIAASRSAGFRHHLVKPLDMDHLERLLEEARAETERPQ